MISLTWVPTFATLVFLQVSSDLSVRLERGFAPRATIPVAMNRADANEAERPVGERKEEKGTSKGKKNADLPPTRENVKYGPHERNVFDIWTAPSKEPTPLLVFIHGGGFINGDKGSIRGKKVIRECLDRGVSFASINYRFRAQAPIQEILRDAARAIQFLRSHAKEWNIDPTRIAAFGGSAGAGTSLWLAVHDDLADPNADDPVLRESSRLTAAGLLNGQASYDLRDWESIVGPTPYQRSPKDRLDFYGFESNEELSSVEGDKVMKDCSMLGLISKDDPPIVAACSLPDGEPMDRGHYVHHPRHATVIRDKCKEQGVECVVILSEDAPRDKQQGKVVEFLLDKLKQ